jgi:hypothetical protein
MDKFPHLRLIQRELGKARIFGGGEKSERSRENLKNRQEHAQYLRGQSENLKLSWDKILQERAADNLPPLDPNIVPILLRIDPASFDVEKAFDGFKIEVISENEDGYILGTSFDGLQGLREKIRHFTEQVGRDKDQASQLWDIIIAGDHWRPEYILSEQLLLGWENIGADHTYTVDVGIACYTKVMERPDNPAKRTYEAKMAEYEAQLRRMDEIFDERTDHFLTFLGERLIEQVSDIIYANDSFSFRISVSGNTLRDIVFNYPYVFEVNEIYELESVSDETIYTSEEGEIEIVAPENSSPQIVVIDSGIQEEHVLIEEAIVKELSFSYLPGDHSVADDVTNGGHGTRVAGAILYPLGTVGLSGRYQLPFFIVNARVLNADKRMPVELYPAALMEEIVEDYQESRIFNLSINSAVPCRTRHMSAWAATIDKLSHEEDVLFIISSGNITLPEVKHHITNGSAYPAYLLNAQNRVANPAQSGFCLAVGSINHTTFNDGFWHSIGERDDVSAFSRCGLGLWGMIKPDVVQYGGGLVKTASGSLVSSKTEVCPPLIRSNLHGGRGTGQDDVGTSYSAPKVSHIAGKLETLYGEESICLIRALIIHGARLPKTLFLNPTYEAIRTLGYGIPSLERVTTNSPHRITLYTSAEIRAEEGHIFSVKIPDEMRSPGNDFDVLLEVTLAFTSQVRRTRQKTKNYLATWMDWESSKKGETLDGFVNFAISQIHGYETQYDKARSNLDTWNWKIGDRKNRGEVESMRRNDSTAQKDWAIIKSFDLPEELCFSVRGHRGWDNNREAIPYAFVISLEMLGKEMEVYEAIRIENEIEIEV